MRLEQLEYLLAIDRYKSISKAAEYIHVSHQAISVAIRQLEEELHAPLLERTPKGSILTSTGKCVVDFAIQTFKNWEKIVTEAIATYDTPEYYKNICFYIFENSKIDPSIAKIVTLIKRHFPNARISINYTYSKKEVFSALKNEPDTLAILMLSELHTIPADLYFVVLTENYLGMQINPNHRLAKNDHCYLDNLVGENILVSTEEKYGPVTEVLESHQINQHNQIFYNYTTEVIGEYIHNNFGIGCFFFPTQFIEQPYDKQIVQKIFEDKIRVYTTCITNSKDLIDIVQNSYLHI